MKDRNKLINEILENNPELKDKQESLTNLLNLLIENNPNIKADPYFRNNLKNKLKANYTKKETNFMKFTFFATMIQAFSLAFAVFWFYYYLWWINFFHTNNDKVNNIEQINETEKQKNILVDELNKTDELKISDDNIINDDIKKWNIQKNIQSDVSPDLVNTNDISDEINNVSLLKTTNIIPDEIKKSSDLESNNDISDEINNVSLLKTTNIVPDEIKKLSDLDSNNDISNEINNVSLLKTTNNNLIPKNLDSDLKNSNKLWYSNDWFVTKKINTDNLDLINKLLVDTQITDLLWNPNSNNKEISRWQLMFDMQESNFESSDIMSDDYINEEEIILKDNKNIKFIDFCNNELWQFLNINGIWICIVNEKQCFEEFYKDWKCDFK